MQPVTSCQQIPRREVHTTPHRDAILDGSAHQVCPKLPCQCPAARALLANGKRESQTSRTWFDIPSDAGEARFATPKQQEETCRLTQAHDSGKPELSRRSTILAVVTMAVVGAWRGLSGMGLLDSLGHDSARVSIGVEKVPLGARDAGNGFPCTATCAWSPKSR